MSESTLQQQIDFEQVRNLLDKQRQTERELRLLNRAVDVSSEAIFLLNSQGRFIYVNDTACCSLGYSRGELLTMTPLDIDPDITQEKFGMLLNSLLTDGPTRGYIESRHRARDGRIFPVELSASVIELDGNRFGLIVARDISERKKSELQLKLLNHALDQVHEGAFLMGEQGRFLYVNQQACRSLGYCQEELLDMAIPDVDPDFSPQRMTESFSDLLRRGAHTFESRHRDKNGRIFPVEITSTLLEYGNARYTLSLVRDITERKQNEINLCRLNEELEERVHLRTADLEQANAKLQQLDLMKSMFIASMSHELRTPLNSVIGFSRILHEEWLGSLNVAQKEYVATILRSGKLLLSLVNDVIDVSRIEAGMIDVVPEEFDVHDVVMEVVSAFENNIKDKGIGLKIQLIHHKLHLDRTRLLQCLLNLVSNAVKYTDNGTITICATIVNEGCMLELSVSDTGIGMHNDDLGKLFAPFVRLDTPLTTTVPGTGLGLYLTQKLVREVLRGDITVTSTVGEGSRFVLMVPVSSQQ